MNLNRPAVSIIRIWKSRSAARCIYRMHVSIRCVSDNREKWKTVGDATRQYQEENPRRIWRNINVPWKMKPIYTHIYIYNRFVDAMTRGQTFIFSPFQILLYFIFWLTKRTAIKFHSFFPPLHFFFLSFSEDSAALFLPTFLPRYRFRTS